MRIKIPWSSGKWDRLTFPSGSISAEAAGEESSPFHRQTGSPRISPGTGTPNNVHISLSTVHRERACTVLSRRGRGSKWEGKVRMDFIKELGIERNHEEGLKF